MIPLLIFVTVLLVLLCAGLWAELRSVTEDRDRMRDAVEYRDKRIVELIRGEASDEAQEGGLV